MSTIPKIETSEKSTNLSFQERSNPSEEKRSSTNFSLLRHKGRTWSKYGPQSVGLGLNIWGSVAMGLSRLPNLGKALIALELSLWDSPESISNINFDNLQPLLEEPEITTITIGLTLGIGFYLLRKNPEKAEIIFSALFSVFLTKAHMERVIVNDSLSPRESGSYTGDFIFFSVFAANGLLGGRYFGNSAIGPLLCLPDDIAPAMIDIAEYNEITDFYTGNKSQTVLSDE